MMERTDVAIIGGGPVGIALALALSGTGLAPVLLEARRVPSSDRRPVALSYGSRMILDRLGVWPRLSAPTPIEQIHVSQSGGFGRVMLTAREARLPALGYVVEYAGLHAALAAALAEHPAQRADGARVVGVQPGDGGPIVEFELDKERRSIEAKLLAVADGGALPDLAPSRRTDYEQVAVVTSVSNERPHRGTAFERFTPHGPLALLPLGSEMAVVWTTSPERAHELCNLSDNEFCAAVLNAVGARLGAFSNPGMRASFPLALRVGAQRPLANTVLVGNAAQTLHPVAGQGFNLGLRDAWELGAEIRRAGCDAVGTPALLAAYRRRRRLDRAGGIGFTHSLVRLFSNEVTPLRALRGAGLTLLGVTPPAREFIIRRMIFGARG